MSKSAFGSPLISDSQGVRMLEAVPLNSGDGEYDEKFIQDLVYEHPECLPIDQIDQTYLGLVPVCCELTTPAGPLDVLYVTSSGRLCILEAKLWRNPEARRKVVGQILDYAQELSRWDYDDLQREVAKRTGVKGNALYEIVKRRHSDVDEAEFVDAVSQSLTLGRFLLLVLGDGIREGVGAITSFIEDVGSLEFTFGLVELAIFRDAQKQLLIQPRVLAKTVVIKRSVVRVQDNQVVLDEYRDVNEVDVQQPKVLSERQTFYKEFWKEFSDQLRLDDKEQEPYKPGRTENFFLPLPPSGSEVWISAYFSVSASVVGVYLRFSEGSFADLAYPELESDRDQIETELGVPVEWKVRNGKKSVITTMHVDDPLAPENREKIKTFFSTVLNNFVNTFRPRLQRIADDL
jgi:Domain of unknown function (DUF4268)